MVRNPLEIWSYIRKKREVAKKKRQELFYLRRISHVRKAGKKLGNGESGMTEDRDSGLFHEGREEKQ